MPFYRLCETFSKPTILMGEDISWLLFSSLMLRDGVKNYTIGTTFTVPQA